jgi:HD-GYP domain-containing protein (c-di-GMP phosphodiesterase class II)
VTTGIRRAELLAALAVISDAGMGHPSDLALRASVLAVGLGKALKLDTQTLSDAWGVSLLRFSGCTSDAHLAAAAFGDEVKARAWLATADFGSPLSVLGHAVRHHQSDKGALTRARLVARAFLRMSGMYGAAQSHCEVAIHVAGRLGFAPRFKDWLSQIFERWDGKGIPRGLKKSQVGLPVRLACLAHDLELFHRISGREGALEMVKKRRGTAHDPSLVDGFLADSDRLFEALDDADPWRAALDAEPNPRHLLAGEALDDGLAALADFADLRSSFTRGHSTGVSALVFKAAQHAGLPEPDAVALRRAALVHDLGRAAVSVSIWDKAGPLTATEREQMRLHSYLTDRCLARCEGLSAVAAVASSAHERLDGKGYHRGLPKPALDLSRRLLAAADAYHAMTEARAHRPALPPDDAAKELRREVAEGRQCPDAARAVLEAAGHPVARRALPGGLSERECEVIRLIARGLSNKEMAVTLAISVKTVGHHIQHIYDKLGVSTRAGATMFAMQHALAQP